MRSRNTISSLNAAARLIRAVCRRLVFVRKSTSGLIAYTASVPIETVPSRLLRTRFSSRCSCCCSHTVPRCRAARVIRLENDRNSAEHRRPNCSRIPDSVQRELIASRSSERDYNSRLWLVREKFGIEFGILPTKRFFLSLFHRAPSNWSSPTKGHAVRLGKFTMSRSW